MVQRLFKLLKHIQEINLSPADTLALLRRLETDSCRAEDYEVLIKIMRVHTALLADGGSPAPGLGAMAPLKAPRPRAAPPSPRR